MKHPELPAILCDVFDAGGIEAVLRLTGAIGGQRIYVPPRPSDKHVLVVHAGRAAADAIAATLPTGGWIEFPKGHAAVRRLLVKKMLEADPPKTSNEIAKALHITRRQAVTLKGKVGKEFVLTVRRRRVKIDPRQIDLEDMLR